jgi:hypothetical protein
VRNRTRILLGVLAVVAVCSAAAGLGRAVGPLERESAEPEHAGETTAMPEGLAVAADGFRLELAQPPLEPGRRQPLAFRIVDDEQRAVTEFELEHEKRMHLILVRRDLAGFQHLHPRMQADGTWHAEAKPLAPGSYRVFADFKAGDRHTLGADVAVSGSFAGQPLPAPSTTATAGPYLVTLDAESLRTGEENELRFEVSRDGRAVAVGTYLGARGHLVILREGDLAYLHNHADEEELAFESSFPSVGRYAAFLQFSVDGTVQTAVFTLEVTE